MLTNCKVFPIQFLHFLTHMLYQCIPVSNQSFCLIFHILQFVSDLKFQIKNCSLQCHHISGCLSFVHAEKLKIATKIENIKFLLVLSVQQSGTQTASSTNHLPEFCFTHDFLEKDKIQYFRHIDSCVQHIYGNCNLRKFIWL